MLRGSQGGDKTRAGRQQCVLVVTLAKKPEAKPRAIQVRVAQGNRSPRAAAP